MWKQIKIVRPFNALLKPQQSKIVLDRFHFQTHYLFGVSKLNIGIFFIELLALQHCNFVENLNKLRINSNLFNFD